MRLRGGVGEKEIRQGGPREAGRSKGGILRGGGVREGVLAWG